MVTFIRKLKNRYFVSSFLLLFGLIVTMHGQTGENIPDWAENVVWYQIFPERFHNADTTNDPTADRIGDPHGWGLDAPEGWEISSWTSDWYQRPSWEQRIGPRFWDSVFSRRYGGDLQGVIDKLDYLKELGVTAIYFNPVFDAVTMHKYDASHYRHIDRFFGPDPEGDLEIMKQEDPNDPDTWQWTSADKLFLELLEEARERGIRVIIDGVWNHTGRDFWAFRDILEHGENSEYKDWYKIIEFSDEYEDGFDYEGWWGYKGLPEFTEVDGDLHPEVKSHIFAVTKRWMAPDGDVNRGVDGWRLDVADELGKEFWRDWHEHVKDINPDALTVAEIWDEAARDYIADDLFGIVMNYRWAYVTHDFFIGETITASTFDELLSLLRDDFAPATNFAMQNLMDSHDTERLATMIVNNHKAYKEDSKLENIENALEYYVHKPDEYDRQLQKLIALFQYTYVGSPMIFYGTEAGMWGADDPDDRKPMIWPDMEYDDEINHPFGLNRQRDEVSFNHELHRWYSKLGQLRAELPDILGTGNYKTIHTDDEQQAIAYSRYDDTGEFAIVLINRGDRDYEFDLSPDNIDLPEVVKDRITENQYNTTNGKIKVSVSPVSGKILTQ